MTVPTITALPEIPAYSDANFETKAPAVLSALRNTFVAEMNAAIAAINSYDYGAAVNISKVIGLTAGYIPYGAGTAALSSSANFVFSSNRLDLTNPSGAQARLTHSAGNYTDFKTDGDGNLTIAPSGDRWVIPVNKATRRKAGISGASEFADNYKRMYRRATNTISGAKKVVTLTIPATTVSIVITLNFMAMQHGPTSLDKIKKGKVQLSIGRLASGNDVVLTKLHYEEFLSDAIGGTGNISVGDKYAIARTGSEANTEPQGVAITVAETHSASAGTTIWIIGEIEIMSFNGIDVLSPDFDTE